MYGRASARVLAVAQPGSAALSVEVSVMAFRRSVFAGLPIEQAGPVVTACRAYPRPAASTTSARSSGMPAPVSDDVASTRGKAAGRLAMALAVAWTTRVLA